MNTISLRRTITAAVVLAGAVPLAAAAPAHAGSDVIRRGSCTGSTDWKIRARPDDGRIMVETEIDSNASGQRWRWVLRHDGDVSARGSARTRAPSGSFSIERSTVNFPGVDAFRFRARNPRSGEICIARVKF